VRLSPPPDLHSNRHLALAAIAVTLLASVGLVGHGYSLAKTLGDPDDAMRLALVHDLITGHGWYDQIVTRLQPPHGIVLHWSRLLDGALVAVTRAFEVVLAPNIAEMAMRFVWPLLWIFPATLCALAIARRLGGPPAAFACAVLLASNQQAFEQFVPGRIDHHNIQIVMTLIAATCAMAREHRPRWALLSGAATGLGLAIGIEALPFHLLIGGSYTLLALTGGEEKSTTRNYAVSLLGTSLLFYCLQTPPWRWSMSFCDAIGFNLVVAIAITSCGLIAVSMNRGMTARNRALILIATTTIAAGIYLALDPLCVRGPLGAVDARIRPFWFNVVEEMQPLPAILKRYRNLGISLAWLSGIVAVAIIFLIFREWPRPRPAMLLASLLAMLATVAGFEAFRMQSYVFWLGFPLLAAAFGALATRYWGGVMLPTVFVSVLFSPVGIGGLLLMESAVLNSAQNLPASRAELHCRDTQEYRQMQMLPPGLALADISIGPFILANTRHSVLNAPYHRMVWGILAAHDALATKTSKAERIFRNLKIDYLVECPADPAQSALGSIEWDVNHGQIPSWLQPLSAKSDALQIYRVRS
jgi:hypothetical protein